MSCLQSLIISCPLIHSADESLCKAYLLTGLFIFSISVSFRIYISLLNSTFISCINCLTSCSYLLLLRICSEICVLFDLFELTYNLSFDFLVCDFISFILPIGLYNGLTMVWRGHAFFTAYFMFLVDFYGILCTGIMSLVHLF